MANTYKNIVITPNIGNNSVDPKVQFAGGNTTANTDINLFVYPASNGTLSFEGTAGQLFSITNDLSNLIFSVADVSGIPSIEAYANGLVTVARISGNVGIGNSTPSHKLSVNGAVSFGNSTITGFLNVSSTGQFGGAVSGITTLAAGNTTITGFVNSTTTGQFGGNLTLASTSAIIANSVAGTSGQVLTSNGSAVYWSTVSSGSGTVTSITMGNGLSSTQSPLTTSGTMSVVAGTGGGLVSNTSGVFVTAGTGTVVNATGVHVNASYIATISANNTTYVNGKTEGNLNVNAAAQLTTARNIGDVSFNGTAAIVPERITYKDTRATNYNAYTYPGVTLHLKTNTTDGLADGGTYHATLGLTQWTDSSGGVDHQLGLTDNGNMWIRYSTGATTWSSWAQLVSTASGTALTANNATNLGGFAAANYARTDTADSFDGVVTFNANAVLTKLLSANASFGTAGQFLRSGATTNTYWGSLLSADVTTALGYTPYNSTNPAGYVTSSGVTSITIGTGLSSTQSPLTTTGTLSVNASYIATIAVPITGGAMTGALTVQGTGAAILQTSGDIYAYRSGGTTGVIFLNSGGTRYLYYDGTNYQMPGTALYVGGDIIAFSSDIRIKKDIRQIEHPLEKIKQIRGVRYNHNEFGLEQGMPKEPQVGVIAQEVEKVLPEVVTLAPFDYDGVDDHGNKRSKSGENYKTVKYEKIVPLLIEAIKELSAQVDDLKKRLGD